MKKRKISGTNLIIVLCAVIFLSILIAFFITLFGMMSDQASNRFVVANMKNRIVTLVILGVLGTLFFGAGNLLLVLWASKEGKKGKTKKPYT